MRRILQLKKALRVALFVLLLNVVGMMKANPVDMNTAREVGYKFINANVTPMRGINDLQIVTTYSINRGDAAFYIFNTPNGFVIVSADDCATPILGYSNEGQFDIEDIPIQMQDYLQDFVEQIQYGIENHIVADADIARQWELVQATGRLTEQRATRIVDPLLSEKWHQNCYYNEKCPVDPAGPCGRVWAGCAATAMGQIMHYWRHPNTGLGSFSYIPNGYPEQSVDFGSTTYQWANMPDRLYSTSDSTAIDAVSTLLWHCGVSVRMSYGVGASAGGSCPDALAALRDHFRYSNDMHVERENFHPFTWENRLKSCLNDSIPLYYIGHNDTAQLSHAFVCDGYDADDFFHFNWGWNGSYNNYFALYAMTPGDHNFNRNHIAIFDIRPNYQVLATCSPGYGGLVSGSGSYINNSSCTLTAIPKSGFSFSHWKEGNDIVSYATIYTFTVKCNRNLVAVFTPLRTITTSSNPTNGGTVSGGGSYPQGCPCTVNATANNGYTFTNWTENGTQVSTNASYTFTVTGNRSLVANFTVQSSQTYTISVSANPTNGGSVSGGGNYQQGQSCTVTATANSGYTFTNWTENGTQVSTNANYTFNVTDDRHLVAHFTSTAPPPPQTYTITVSANPSSGGSVTGGNTYQQGASCTVTATPAAGYSFQKWTVNGVQVSTSANYTFTVTGDRHLVAHFTSTAPPPPQTYTINTTSSPIYGGSTSGGGTYQQGESCTLTASASSGYAFDYWTEGNNVVSNNSSYTFTVDHDRNLVANFYERTYHITVSANPTDGGTVTGAGYYYYDEYCTVAATANYGYDFVNWTRNGNEVSTNPNYTFLVHGSRNFVANFQPQSFTIMTISNSTEYGIVSGHGIYDYGQECTLTATANDGCAFTNWTENDSVVSTDANYTFTITGDRSLVANFQAQSSIVFADTYVKSICVGVANWDTNGDSQLSYDEAASVTSLGQVFSYAEITSFEELQYFSGLTTIDNYAFYHCIELTGGLSIPNSVTSIGDYAFFACNNLTGDLVIPNSVTSIGNFAFCYCSGFTGILTIPNSVTTIGDYAFASGNGFIGSLIIPNSVTTIGDYAFAHCSGFTGNLTISNSLTMIGARAFYDCWGLTGDLTIPNSVTTIGQDAFNGCTGFNGDLHIPRSVTSIGSAAFCDCTGITSITAQAETPLAINSMTFYNCPKYIPVYVPCGSVEAYQSAAYWNEFTNIQEGWYNITVSYVEAGGSVTGAGNYCLGDTCTLTATTNDGYTFQYWTKNGGWVSDLEAYSFLVSENANYMAHFESVEGENIVFADTIVKAICVANWDANGDGELSYVEAASVTRLGQVFSGNTEITSFEELQYFIGLTSIDYYAFQGCSGLTGNLFIPNSVTSIGAKAFQGCSGLTGHLIIPNSVTSIEGLAFYNCSGFTGSLTIPNSVTLIDSYAFYNCSGFSSLTIGNSVVMIDRAAFYNCNRLASLTIGSSVTSIVDEAFYYCRHLHSITVLAETPPTIQSSLVFYYCHKDIPVYVPCGSLEAYMSAPYWSEFTNIQELCPQTQTITLSQGWNWISTYIDMENNDGLSQLTDCLGTNGLQIITTGGSLIYRGGSWIGSITSLSNTKAYKIKTNAPVTVTITGSQAADPANCEIQIMNGWNWIAYPLSESKTVAEALAGFEPSNGDNIKTQGGSAVYRNGNWLPNTFTFEPGKGYTYKSTATQPKTLIFQTGSKQ